MSQTYYAILTAIGEAKLANATALGVPLQISRMAAGDGNGALPNPDRLQPALIHENYRADLNSLTVDPVNTSQIIAELVIPEGSGGWWIREMGLDDATGALVAVCNCPPSYKPQLAEGSGKTQVLRMVLVVSSTAAVELKIDPSVVLATRDFVTLTVASELAKLDSKQSVRVATTATTALAGLLTIDGVVLVAGDRVLIKDQATGSQNGIYVASAGAWVRATDVDISAEVTSGLIVSVESGTTLADTRWQLVTDGTIVLGTTSLSFQNVTAGFAPLASPALIGAPTAPTAAPGTNTSQLATTAFVEAAVGVGNASSFAMRAAPAGWIKANGAVINRTTYAALFAAIGTEFGAGDGSTTFKVPDLRGEFVRGWDDGRGIDAGRAFGGMQLDEIRSHQHLLGYNSSSTGSNTGGGGYFVGGTLVGLNTGPTGGAETRPRNVSLLVCIKY
jgi:phage-related tail fiber protein